MRFVFFICLLSLSLFATQDTGFIDITAEPGMQIYLDGTSTGTTSTEQNGLVIRNVSPGTHTLKAVQNGYTACEMQVDVSAGVGTSITIEGYMPALKIEQTGMKAHVTTVQFQRVSGHLFVRTIPVETYVSIPELGITQNKIYDILKIENIPAGTYTLICKADNSEVQQSITIPANDWLSLEIDCIEKTVKDISAAYPDPVTQEYMLRKVQPASNDIVFRGSINLSSGNGCQIEYNGLTHFKKEGDTINDKDGNPIYIIGTFHKKTTNVFDESIRAFKEKDVSELEIKNIKTGMSFTCVVGQKCMKGYDEAVFVSKEDNKEFKVRVGSALPCQKTGHNAQIIALDPDAGTCTYTHGDYTYTISIH